MEILWRTVIALEVCFTVLFQQNIEGLNFRSSNEIS